MVKTIIITIFLLLCYALTSFLDRKSKVRWHKLFWYFCLVTTMLLILLQGRDSYLSESELAKTKQRAADIEKQLTPRTMLDSVAQKVTAQLKRFKGMSVILSIGVGDAEALVFAQQIDAVFSKAGWATTIRIEQFPEVRKGLVFTFRGPALNPLLGDTFTSLADTCGRTPVISSDPNLPEGVLRIMVGPK